MNNRPFFPVSNFHVLAEDMDSGGERLGGQMFGRRRRVLSVLLLIYILWYEYIPLCQKIQTADVVMNATIRAIYKEVARS